MTEQAASGRRGLRVATYNVLVDGGGDGRDSWSNRVDDVAGVVAFDSPALVGFQETTAKQFEDLRERLPGYDWVGIGRQGGNDGEFCPVGYQTDRFELRAEETLWLSETPSVAGSASWGSAFPRILTRVRLRERATDQELVFANTHLDHESAQARREGARLVRERIVADDVRDERPPVILCGDFNCEPESEPYRILTGDHGDGLSLRDTRDVGARPPLGPSVTFTGFSDPATGERIDHVFVSPSVDVVQHATRADTRGDGRFPSDHLPVMVDVVLP